MRRPLRIMGQPTERRDARENREKILAALQRMLQTTAMEDICMDAVAEQAGVGKGTLYRHFKDRSSLCHTLLDDAARTLQNETIKGVGLPRDPGARLRAFIDRLVAFNFDNLQLLSEANASAKTPEQSFAHPARAWQHYELHRLLTACNVADALRIADWILALLDPRLFLWQLNRGEARESIAASVANFIARGIHVD